MNVLVTGGAGYIGSHTCKALALAGHNPIVYDNLSTGHRELVRWGAFVRGDVLDGVRLARCMREHGADGVIHFAALSRVGESVAHPDRYYRNNIAGTQSLLEAMRETGVRHLVVSSTCAVYGQPETVPIGEDCRKNPLSPYGVTKALMETMLEDYSRAYGLSGAALRYFNAAGCDAEQETGEWHEPETHLIPLVIEAAGGGAPPLRLFGDDYPTGDGTCIRDYVHVADLADAHVRALEHVRDKSGLLVLNLGTGRGHSVREIIETAEKVLGKTVPVERASRRPGDPPRLVADAAKAASLLGWEARCSDLANIVLTAARWRERLASLRRQEFSS